MKIKIGDEWFEATPEQPIMVLLSDDDKHNIANMDPAATKYALFADGTPMTREEKLEWMDDPSD